MAVDRESALASKAWPFVEAEKLLKRVEQHPPADGVVVFETGYGPSGLPHIGTFGEVARTTMVRHAFSKLSELPTRLIAFSDDMDGLRKVPDNVPDPEKYQKFCPVRSDDPEAMDQVGGVSLTAIPDPFGTHDSYGAHMNGRLKAFLDTYGFDYEFKSATECYASGMFDATLLAVAEHHEAICNIVKPALSEKRQQHYSPFLPVYENRPLQVDVTVVDAKKGIIGYHNPLDGGQWHETEVTGGKCKLQWRADWGMRWAALGVDYEMYGKDLVDAAQLAGRICKEIGGKAPEGFVYEMFLDEKGQKISKSKGNGLTMEEWLRYGTPESLAYYMYQSPRKAKRLYFDVIPKAVDEYLAHLGKYAEMEEAEQLKNPVWHVHSGEPPVMEVAVTFSLILNLASACNPEDKSVLWGFISRYAPEATPETAPHVDALVERALNYYTDFVLPHKEFRAASEQERTAMETLVTELQALPAGAEAEAIQNVVYAVGKAHGFENLREWFGALYEVLLGQKQGPRMGSFIALYGVEETIALINKALKDEVAAG